MTTTFKDIDEKLVLIMRDLATVKSDQARDLAEVKQNQAVVKTALDMLTEISRKHERIFYGENGGGGMIETVNMLKRANANLIKALWFVFAPLLTGIGGGVIYLIAHGVAVP